MPQLFTPPTYFDCKSFKNMHTEQSNLEGLLWNMHLSSHHGEQVGMLAGLRKTQSAEQLIYNAAGRELRASATFQEQIKLQRWLSPVSAGPVWRRAHAPENHKQRISYPKRSLSSTFRVT